MDRVFKALADPSRRVMVERLSQGEASVSELARPLEMSLSAVMQHLQVLEASGLVRSEKLGRARTCRIEPKALHLAEQWIAKRRTMLAHRFDQLGEVPSLPTNQTSQEENQRDRAIGDARDVYCRAQPDPTIPRDAHTDALGLRLPCQV